MKYKNVIIAVVIIITGVAAFYKVAVYKNNEPPAGFVSSASREQADTAALLDTAGAGLLQGSDPCNGTGGTGQIISVDSNSITIRRRDGVSEVVKLTEKTTIRNAAGPLSKAGLKPGNRVTVVVMSNHTATAVLVCNQQSPG
ncbi:MAG TPA: hypothetical protein VHB48_18250 [Chitinophagaceae bacterium]|nr:hypothetical protein [Chitinophagaceae bacterium]